MKTMLIALSAVLVALCGYSQAADTKCQPQILCKDADYCKGQMKAKPDACKEDIFFSRFECCASCNSGSSSSSSSSGSSGSSSSSGSSGSGSSSSGSSGSSSSSGSSGSSSSSNSASSSSTSAIKIPCADLTAPDGTSYTAWCKSNVVGKAKNAANSCYGPSKTQLKCLKSCGLCDKANKPDTSEKQCTESTSSSSSSNTNGNTNTANANTNTNTANANTNTANANTNTANANTNTANANTNNNNPPAPNQRNQPETPENADAEPELNGENEAGPEGEDSEE